MDELLEDLRTPSRIVDVVTKALRDLDEITTLRDWLLFAALSGALQRDPPQPGPPLEVREVPMRTAFLTIIRPYGDPSYYVPTRVLQKAAA